MLSTRGIIGSLGSFGDVPPRYNGAPSQQLWVIRRNPRTGERSLDLLQWGLIPYWCKDKPKPPPMNAKAETVDRLPMFREAYRKRRCIVRMDGFFEWLAIKGGKVKQPYVPRFMKDRSPFGLAGLWENWKNPATGEWVRTFCIITTAANELVGRIHDRMPAILRPEDYGRWLALDPDGPNLLQPFPSRADGDMAYFDARELAVAGLIGFATHATLMAAPARSQLAAQALAGPRQPNLLAGLFARYRTFAT